MTISSETRFVRISIPKWEELCLGRKGDPATKGQYSSSGLSFWKKPTRHTGFYEEVTDHPLGLAIYGFWCAFVDAVLDQEATLRGSYRGFRGLPFTADRLARRLRTQPGIVVSAVEHLSRIGAIEVEIENESKVVQSGSIQNQSGSIHDSSNSKCPYSPEVEVEVERELTTSARSDSADAEITSEPEEAEEPKPNTPPTEPLARWPSWWDPGRVGKRQRSEQVSFAARFPELLAEWRQVFPALDVVAELAKAHAWELANPGRRKTPRGRARFLHGWLERAQDRGGLRNGHALQGATAATAAPAPRPLNRPPWLVNCPMGACEIRPGEVAETTLGLIRGPFPHGGWYRHMERKVHRWLDAAATSSEPVPGFPAEPSSWSPRTRDGPPGLRGCAESAFEASSAGASRNHHPNAGDGQ